LICKEEKESCQGKNWLVRTVPVVIKQNSGENYKGVAGAGQLPSLLAVAAYCTTPYLLRLTIYSFMNVLVGWWLRQARLMAGCPVPRLAGQWRAARAAPASGWHLPLDVEALARELPGQ